MTNIFEFYGSDEDEQVFRENQMRDHRERVELLHLVDENMDEADIEMLYGEEKIRFQEVMWSWRMNLLFEMWWL